MAKGGTSKGAAQAVDSAMDEITAFAVGIEKLGRDTFRITGKESDELAGKIKKLTAEFEKEDKTAGDLTKVMHALATGSKKAQKTLDKLGMAALNAKWAKEQKVLTGLRKKEMEQDRVLAQRQIKLQLAIKGAGTSELTAANKKLRQLDQDLFDARIEDQKELGKAQASQGRGFMERMKGPGNVLSAHAKKTGANVARFSNKAFGVPVKGMMQIAKVAGFAMMGLTALMFIFRRVAGGAVDAAKSGREFSGSVTQTGASYNKTAKEAGRFGLGLAISEDKIRSLDATMTKEFLPSLAATDTEFIKAARGTAAERNAIRDRGTAFIGSTAMIGKALGMTAEEAVSTATKLGVLSRGSLPDAQKSLITLDAVARKNFTTIGGLVGIFEILAKQSEFLGDTTEKLTNKTVGYLKTAKSLEGVRGFERMTDEQRLRVAKEMATVVSGIGEMRLAAMSQRPGGTFNQAIHRVSGIKTEGRQNIIRNMMDRFNLGAAGKRGDSANISGAAFKLAQIMGESGGVTDMVRKGKMLATFGEGKGNFSEGDLEKFRGQQIDESLDRAKSTGAYLAMGGDPLALMARHLKDILTLMVDWAVSIPTWIGGSTRAVELKADRSKKPPLPYGGSVRALRAQSDRTVFN